MEYIKISKEEKTYDYLYRWLKKKKKSPFTKFKITPYFKKDFKKCQLMNA